MFGRIGLSLVSLAIGAFAGLGALGSTGDTFSDVLQPMKAARGNQTARRYGKQIRKTGKTYQPNGAREVARRLRHAHVSFFKDLATSDHRISSRKGKLAFARLMMGAGSKGAAQ